MGVIKRFRFIKRPRIFIPLIIVMGLIAICVVIIRNMSQPAVGTIEQTPLQKAEVIDPYAQPGIYKGKYISFKYPAHYKSVPTKLSGSYLEVAAYHITDSTGKQISVGVLPGGIQSSGDVQFRRQQKNIYKETTSNIGLEFVKSDGTEDSFFIEHGGMIASISVTAPYNNQAGDALFVASSLKWK